MSRLQSQVPKTFGWVSQSGQIFDSFYTGTDWLSPAWFLFAPSKLGQKVAVAAM